MSGHFCVQGHPKFQRPSGEWVCKPCVNAVRRARRRLAASKSCPHIGVVAFDGIVSTQGHMVCVQCLVEESNLANSAAMATH